MRVSDEDREEVVELLRGHMLAGRLTHGELEERIGEAWSARDEAQLDRVLRELPPRRAPVARAVRPVFVRGHAQPRGGGETTALTLGIAGLALVTLTIGLLSIFALPLSIAAWVVGRDARRRSPGSGVALAGQVLGVIGTLVCLLIIFAFGYWVF